MSETVEVTLPIPPGWIGFVGSPGEFARAGHFAGRAFDGGHVLPIGDGRRELRLFMLPPDSAVRADLTRVPGFNIKILHAGQLVAVRDSRTD